jgi:hypothetical protein
MPSIVPVFIAHSILYQGYNHTSIYFHFTITTITDNVQTYHDLDLTFITVALSE